jgi:L-lactate dehydrogenase complex protein LldE
MNENKSCCGAETSFSMKHENISSSMADQKVQNALATGAQYIVSTDASCLMHQEGYIKKQNLAIQTIHLIDVLASGWE